MRFRSSDSSSAFLLSFYFFSRLALATPFSTSSELADLNNVTLIERRCANPCGWQGQLCCESNQSCYTDANDQAQCGSGGWTTAAPQGGYWQYYTTTYVETDLYTKTSVYSSYVQGPATVIATTTYCPPGQATETAQAAQCNTNQGESSCGNICCASWQYCVVSGQCGASGQSNTYSAPLRVTTSGYYVVTQTQAATTTVPFLPAESTGSIGITTTTESSSGLSGGAIAGIVIGVILGLIFLLLLCLCLCFRAAWDGFLALFGLGRSRRRTETTVVEESYRRRGDQSDSRRWYGDAPSRIERPQKKSGGIGWGGVGAGLAGLAVVLGLKRKYDKRRDEKTQYSGSSDYYSDDYTASESYESERRDTRRDTRRDRRR